MLCQFTVPRSEFGITRHVDIFDRVRGWDFTIVAGHLNHYSQRVIDTPDDRFVLVRVPRYSGAGFWRIAAWVVYSSKAVLHGLRHRPDVVVASSPQMLTPVAGAVVASLWRRPLVVEVRDLWPETLVAAGALRRGSRLHRALVALERWNYRRADHLVAVTSGWEDHFASLGVPADRVTVVSNGTEPVAPPVASREELRSRHGITGTTAVYAGAHGPANDLDAVLDAARELPDLRVLLIGAGSEKERLRTRAREESLDNVEFRDPIPKTDLNELLVACDIGVHAIGPLAVLQLGMSPNKLFDYLAAGLPVVSNAGAGLARVLGDTECALVGGPDSLSASLQQLLHEGAERRAARGRVGTEVVATRFSRESAGAAMKEVLEGVI